MFVGILGWFISTFSGPTIGRIVDIVAKRSDAANSEQLEKLKAITSEGHDLSDFNKAKLGFPWFWLLISVFIVPLGVWWTLVIADSIFAFPFDVSNLPTPEMRQWAGDMIRWLFYVGSVTAAVKAVSK